MRSQQIQRHILAGDHHIIAGGFAGLCRQLRKLQWWSGWGDEQGSFRPLPCGGRYTPRSTAARMLLVRLQIGKIHAHLLADPVGGQLSFFNQIIYLKFGYF
ncbi:hypothetical protein D3C85_1672890 [compost metagenome]